MRKSHKLKPRKTVYQILASLSDSMFPADMGQARITIHSQEADGDGVLHSLLYGRSLHPVKALIEAGADVNLVGNQGFTPLHVAAWTDHPDAVECLLAAGADPTLRCTAGATPLDIALKNDFNDIVRLLQAR